jgi:anti-anti-sigma factor
MSSVRVGSDIWWVAVFGDIELATGDEVHAEITAATALPGLRYVIVDLTHATFLDAHGVGILVRSRRALDTAGIQLKLIGASGTVARVLRMTRLDDAAGMAAGLVDDHELPGHTGRGRREHDGRT